MEPSSISDLNASVATVLQIKLFPADRPVLYQILIAAGVPMLAVVGTQLPLTKLLKWVVDTIL